MRKAYLTIIFAFALGCPALAQVRPVSSEEFEFFQRVNQERQPARQISVLLEWEAAVPNSGWQRERILFLVTAYRDAGQLMNSFTSATRLLELAPRDLTAWYSLVTIAPLLKNPSSDQIRVTEEAANHLLSSPQLSPPVMDAGTQVADRKPEETSDVEAKRVDGFLREIRNRNHIEPVDVERKLRRAAENALVWARNQKR
jgi:hypothetical protein